MSFRILVNLIQFLRFSGNHRQPVNNKQPQASTGNHRQPVNPKQPTCIHRQRQATSRDNPGGAYLYPSSSFSRRQNVRCFARWKRARVRNAPLGFRLWNMHAQISSPAKRSTQGLRPASQSCTMTHWRHCKVNSEWSGARRPHREKVRGDEFRKS